MSMSLMVKLLYSVTYHSLELKNALHKAVHSDGFSSEDFIRIVKGLGKDRFVAVLEVTILVFDE